MGFLSVTDRNTVGSDDTFLQISKDSNHIFRIAYFKIDLPSYILMGA